MLIVPEQYSHEAERELCEACGDRLSLYAEVMSFTGLARWSMIRHGGGAEPRMDAGGKLLCMALALRQLQPILRIYGKAAANPDLQAMMVREADRLSAAASNSDELRTLAEELSGELGEKLKEFALIQEAYETAIRNAGATAVDPLCLLAEQIERFGLPEFENIYVDGFIDFTGLEMNVMKAILRRTAALTVCLPVEENSREEFFLPSRLAMETLKKCAEESDSQIIIQPMLTGENQSMLRRFADHMFDYAASSAPTEDSSIRLLQAENPRAECEAAAAEILRAVREDGCRWRDVAVAVRGFEEYRGILENTFRQYEIPLFVTRRDTLMEKPLPLWIETAYDIILSGWDTDDVTAYLRSGLSGLNDEGCDALCRYLYKWQLRAGAWMQEEPWRQHPDGYGKPWNEDAIMRLREINASRRLIAGPLLKLKERASAARTAREQTEALEAFLKESNIVDILEDRVSRLEQAGDAEIRAEYTQLWDLCMGAVEQISDVLGDQTLDTEAFRELLHAVLTQYDISLIPVALDRVSAGDFDRMRRRNIRRLIVLGCSDDRLPQADRGAGLFNTEERDVLAGHNLMIGGGDAELWREYALLYHTLSLPHDQLIMSTPVSGLKGELTVPAMVYTQAQRLFQIRVEKVSVSACRLSAAQPAMSLAVSAGKPGAGEEAAAAAAWFEREDPQRLRSLKDASVTQRRNLSPAAVEALYGRRITLTPSRMESFGACRFQYYCNYGLRAEEDEPAAFHAPEIGTFIHAVLELTAREVQSRGGFAMVSDEDLGEIVERVVSEYIHTELGDFQEKTARFRYLFQRVCSDVRQIVLDTAEELRRSDFQPLSFELDVSRLTAGEREDLLLSGIADRVDGWIRGDELLLRIVDYKTGKKKFSLSDIWYGRNMQMLLYLFTVCDHAETLYGRPAIPAGVIYLPAREELLQFDSAPDEARTRIQRQKTKRRSGLVLDDPELIEAWEHGPEKRYIPVRVSTADPLVSLEQMGLLRRHVEETVRQMAEELRAGSISVNPGYVSESDNACRTCPYHSICRFEEGENGEYSCPTPKLSEAEVWQRLQEEKA